MTHFFWKGWREIQSEEREKRKEKKKKLIGAQPLLRNAHAPGHQKRTT